MKCLVLEQDDLILTVAPMWWHCYNKYQYCSLIVQCTGLCVLSGAKLSVLHCCRNTSAQPQLNAQGSLIQQ